MRNNEIVARHIAAAIRACNGQRITQEAAKAAAAGIAKDSTPDDISDNLGPLLNLSALNQELERHGLVKTERSKPALIVTIEQELAKL